jgi:hypothetical protein
VYVRAPAGSTPARTRRKSANRGSTPRARRRRDGAPRPGAGGGRPVAEPARPLEHRVRHLGVVPGRGDLGGRAGLVTGPVRPACHPKAWSPESPALAAVRRDAAPEASALDEVEAGDVFAQLPVLACRNHTRSPIRRRPRPGRAAGSAPPRRPTAVIPPGTPAPTAGRGPAPPTRSTRRGASAGTAAGTAATTAATTAARREASSAADTARMTPERTGRPGTRRRLPRPAPRTPQPDQPDATPHHLPRRSRSAVFDRSSSTSTTANGGQVGSGRVEPRTSVHCPPSPWRVGGTALRRDRPRSPTPSPTAIRPHPV